MKRLALLVLVALSLGSFLGEEPCASQEIKYALSTNLAHMMEGATLDMGASLSVSRHWSLDAAVKYNPYYDASRERSFELGTRFWPWYSYSGWWMEGAAKYQEYSKSSSNTAEGDRYGASISGGYSHMLGKHFNLDVGFGLWGGYERYMVYDCETCGRIREAGARYFFLPNDFILGLTFVF